MKLFKLPFSITGFFLVIIILTLFFYISPVLTHAQTPCALTGLNQGLISALSKTGGGTIGNTAQTCVLDAQAAYRDFKVPTYTELEDQFYTLSRSNAKSSGQVPTTFSGDGIYLHTGNLNIGSAGPVTGGGVQVIFVKGNLDITVDIDYAENDPYSGLVFVVSDKINIYSNGIKVNAVLISSGEICTAAYFDGTNTACLNDNSDTPQLTINGSLISLSKLNHPSGISAIKLSRSLSNNNQPSEIINKQPKYLFLLRNGLFTKDLILTEEDKNYIVTANTDPNPPPTPPPPPACPGSPNPLVIPSGGFDFKSISDCVLSIFDS